MAGSQRIGRTRYAVYGTAPKGTKPRRHTDIAMAAILGHHIGQMNSVRQAMWARYAAFVVGNSIVIAIALGTGQFRLLSFAAACFGILLCQAWVNMYVADWLLLVRLATEAKRFQFPLLGANANPAAVLLTDESWEHGLRIYRSGVRGILLFLGLHFIMFLARTPDPVWKFIVAWPIWKRLLQCLP